jgi:hypothetical protein
MLRPYLGLKFHSMFLGKIRHRVFKIAWMPCKNPKARIAQRQATWDQSAQPLPIENSPIALLECALMGADTAQIVTYGGSQ